MNLKTEIRNEHPRPDFKRDFWLNLNGIWEFEFDDYDIGKKEKWFLDKEFTQKIIVPFTYQTELSGLGVNGRHDVIWYKREFHLPPEFRDKRVLLKFGAVDFYSQIWVNGIFIGEHSGGYSSFGFDITNAIQSNENTIVVRVEDRLDDRRQPRGKQSWMPEPFGCWYTGYSGIWQTVWLEAVADVYIEQVKLTPDIDRRKIGVTVLLNDMKPDLALSIAIKFQDRMIARVNMADINKYTELEINIESNCFEWNGIKLWAPETPDLYDIEINLLQGASCSDRVQSYFGMRKVSIRGNQFLLNNTPYYQKLLLNQGYFYKGGITADSEATFISDIDLIKKMGFNGVRMHQKIEDPLFLYWCDRKGLLVWEEMPSFYQLDEKAVKIMASEWPEIITRDVNHPCIVTWEVFNESWGVNEVATDLRQQNLVRSLYYLTKALDPTRPVVDNDGWEHTETDICTIHDYEPDGDRFRHTYADFEQVVQGAPSRLYPRYLFAYGFKYQGQPVMLSEFGGIACVEDDGWGYGNKVADQSEFFERLAKMYKAILETKYIYGYCYTQFTDVQQEKNGLLTMERKPKIDVELIRKLNLMIV